VLLLRDHVLPLRRDVDDQVLRRGERLSFGHLGQYYRQFFLRSLEAARHQEEDQQQEDDVDQGHHVGNAEFRFGLGQSHGSLLNPCQPRCPRRPSNEESTYWPSSTSELPCLASRTRPVSVIRIFWLL